MTGTLLLTGRPLLIQQLFILSLRRVTALPLLLIQQLLLTLLLLPQRIRLSLSPMRILYGPTPMMSALTLSLTLVPQTFLVPQKFLVVLQMLLYIHH